jgi:hypothetical protein
MLAALLSDCRPSGSARRFVDACGFVGTNPDELEKNLIRAEVCGGEGMRSCFAIASVQASAVSAGQLWKASGNRA